MPKKIYYIVSAVVGIGLVLSLLALNMSPSWKLVVVACWLVLPPLFFVLELRFVRKNKPAELEDCRIGQELASRVWAGIAGALAVVYFDTSFTSSPMLDNANRVTCEASRD